MVIYFSGIGGVGIGPLAEIALDAGYRVFGSDMATSLMTDELQARGVNIASSQDGSYIAAVHEQTPIDWFVYTAALPPDHPELVYARKNGIKTTKRDELLAYIIKQKDLKLIAVSGTHGKTTATGMLVWTLKQLGIPISYSLGTTISFGPSGAYDPKSQYFVYECDEFDRNMLHFEPYLSLITTIGYDHIDTYPTKTDYYSAFRQFMHQSDYTILWQTDDQLITSARDASWSLKDNEVQELKLAGEHNRRNGTLVLKALEKLKIGENAKNRQLLELFPGTNRRFEKLTKNLYTDYGHHPTEIAATLQLARELSDNIVLVYQPHQNVRQHEIKDRYKDCFSLAETVYWLPTYLSREDPKLEILSPEQLINYVDNKASIVIAEFGNDLWQKIQTARNDQRLVVCMGAGSIDNWLRHNLAKSDTNTNV